MKTLLIAVAVGLLAGCDDSQFEAIRHRSEVNERIRLACLPSRDERVVVGWYQGQLLCWRLAKESKPGVHQTPAIVATYEEIVE